MGAGQDGRWSMGIGGRGFFLLVCNHVGQKGEAGRGQSALLPLQRWYIFFPPPSPDLPPFKQEGWPVPRILATPGGGSKLRRPPDILFELYNQILMATHLKGMFNWSQLVSAPSSVIRLYCHVRMWHHIEIFSSPNQDGWCYEKISSPVCVK